MSSEWAWAVLAGLGLGVGLWTLVARLPRLGASRLAARVAPYVLDVSEEARRLRRRRPEDPASVVAELIAPVGLRARRLLSDTLGGDASIERRLRQADDPRTVAGFRSRQLVSGAMAAALGCALAVAFGGSVALPWPAAVALGTAVAVGGVLAPERLLVRRAKARLARVAAELPTVLEFLSLALSAGETVRDALRRVASVGSGELAREFGRVMADVDHGVPLADALADCAASLELPALGRVVEQLVSALERGSPLIEVLRAQAQDSREDAKRALLESAGRREVAMLVPLVFLILPVTIVFAIFPASLVLQLGF